MSSMEMTKYTLLQTLFVKNNSRNFDPAKDFKAATNCEILIKKKLVKFLWKTEK